MLENLKKKSAKYMTIAEFNQKIVQKKSSKNGPVVESYVSINLNAQLQTQDGGSQYAGVQRSGGQ